jgi:hypothetical protein
MWNILNGSLKRDLCPPSRGQGALYWGYLGPHVFALIIVSSTIIAAGLERVSGAM